MRIKLLLFIFLLSSSLLQAAFQPATGEQYMIGCYNTGVGGITVASSGDYPLLYDASATVASTEAFWIITEESAGKYSLKSAKTNRYVKYNPDKTDEKFVEMVSALSGDATLFTFSPRSKNGNEYYAIVSVTDNKQFFNKRSYNAVGTYTGTYSDNELFYFVAKSSITELDGNLQAYLDALTFNGNQAATCTRTKSLYVSLPLQQMKNANVELNIEYRAKSANYKLCIENTEVGNGTPYTFIDVSATRKFKLEVVQDGTVLASSWLIFTGLPIVQLYSTNTLNTEFSQGSIRVHEPEKGGAYELLNAEIRHRGASALSYQKKSFAVKVKDANWKNLDKSFFGLRDDKYWILDAMAADRSRMRNRVSTDLWNDFSAAPYFKAEEKKMVNGTRGKYVEVFLDNQYWGLYCMTERIDRKQLKLKKLDETSKAIKGVLYKTEVWSYSVMMGYVPDAGPDPNRALANYNNRSLKWDGHEFEYPDLEDGEPIDWKPLYDVVNFVAKSSNSDFRNGVTTQVDLPVWLDYYLLMELNLATDNHGKNAYLYMYDISKERKLGICVWDMDGVFGMKWNRSRVAARQDYTNFIIANEHGEHNLFRRLKADGLTNFNTLKKNRYNQLRFTVFAADSLQKRFEIYKNQFDASGAAEREKNRWNNVDGVSINFDEELNYLKTWIADRCSYLNEKYGTPSSIKKTTGPAIVLYPNPVTDELLFEGDFASGCFFNIRNTAGQPVASGLLKDNSIDVGSLPAGVYLLILNDGNENIIKKFLKQ